MKKYLKKEWKLVTVTVILCGILMLIKGTASLIQMRMFDYIIEGDLKGVFIFLGIISLTWIVFFVLNLVECKTETKAVARMNNQVREDISSKILKRDFSKFRQNNTGEYLSWYINDVNQIENLGFRTFFETCFYVFSLVVGALMLLAYHWLLLVMSVVSALITIFVSKKMDKYLQRGSKKVSKMMEVFSERTKEQISGFSFLRSFGLLSSYKSNVNKESNILESGKRDFEVTKEKCSLVVNVSNTIVNMCTNMLLFTLAIVGIVPLNIIFGGTNLVAMVSQATSSFGTLRMKLSSSKPYFEKIETGETAKDSKKEMATLVSDISIENVSFSYEDKEILKNLSLKFSKNKKYALVGESGSGKTTIFRLILGYLEKYDGKVLFDGEELGNFDLDSIQKQIAYIEQEVFLFNTSIRENITLGMDFKEEDLRKAIKDSALEADIEGFEEGIDTVVGENGNKLSGGQRQRVAIARALLHNRSILLVDEGTSALDRKNAQMVENCLLNNKDLTLILISHNLSEEQREKFDAIYEIKKNRSCEN